MTELRAEPVGTWPGEPTKYRQPSPFRSSFTATLDKLEDELDRVKAGAVVVQLDIDRRELHVNAVRASLKPSTPGVVVSFTAPKLGKVRFVCDRFTHWHENLRAIALGMEALRKVERYGITSDGQQYAGFKALEASAGARGFESADDAARYVARMALGDADDDKVERIADAMLIDDELAATYFRRAARMAHPDAGGDDTVMARLNAARAMLEGVNA